MMLGEIIQRLEKEDPNRVVPLGWNRAYSWRGIYSELAVNPAKNVPIKKMLEVLKDSLGQTFTGYKGGEYQMGEYTDVYLDLWGRSNGNRIGFYLLEFLLGNTPEPETY
jgi:hypothetical protein